MERLTLRFDNRRWTPATTATIAAVAGLVAIGWVIVFSASNRSVGAGPELGLGKFLAQGRGVLIGLVAACVVARIDPRYWIRRAPYILCFVAGLLVMTLIVGVERNGAKRWLNFGTMVQSSELAKIAVPLMIAWCFHRFPSLHLSKRDVTGGALAPGFADRWAAEAPARRRLRHLQFLGMGTIVALIAVQPDLGTAAFVLAIGTGLLLMTNVPIGITIGYAILAVPGVVALVLLRWKEIVERFSVIWNPEGVDQVKHSLLAISSGGFWGKGLGASDAKTFFLPEPHNDFVFAVFAEECGFVGVMLLFGLYVLLLHSSWRMVRRCPEPSLRLLGLAIVCNLVLQCVMNLAVVTAIAPTKGIGLPFVSFGSSSLAAALLQVGLLVAISRISLGSEDVEATPELRMEHGDGATDRVEAVRA